MSKIIERMTNLRSDLENQYGGLEDVLVSEDMFVDMGLIAAYSGEVIKRVYEENVVEVIDKYGFKTGAFGWNDDPGIYLKKAIRDSRAVAFSLLTSEKYDDIPVLSASVERAKGRGTTTGLGRHLGVCSKTNYSSHQKSIKGTFQFRPSAETYGVSTFTDSFCSLISWGATVNNGGTIPAMQPYVPNPFPFIPDPIVPYVPDPFPLFPDPMGPYVPDPFPFFPDPMGPYRPDPFRRPMPGPFPDSILDDPFRFLRHIEPSESNSKPSTYVNPIISCDDDNDNLELKYPKTCIIIEEIDDYQKFKLRIPDFGMSITYQKDGEVLGRWFHNPIEKTLQF